MILNPVKMMSHIEMKKSYIFPAPVSSSGAPPLPSPAERSLLYQMASISGQNGAFGGFHDPRTSQNGTFINFLKIPLTLENKAMPFVPFQAIW